MSFETKFQRHQKNYELLQILKKWNVRHEILPKYRLIFFALIGTKPVLSVLITAKSFFGNLPWNFQGEYQKPDFSAYVSSKYSTPKMKRIRKETKKTYPRNLNCMQGMGPSMPALIVIAVSSVIAFCTREMGPRITFAKMRFQDSPLSCVQGSDATICRPYTRLYAEHKRGLYAEHKSAIYA
jgi:hypothetical protein